MEKSHGATPIPDCDSKNLADFNDTLSVPARTLPHRSKVAFWVFCGAHKISLIPVGGFKEFWRFTLQISPYKIALQFTLQLCLNIVLKLVLAED